MWSGACHTEGKGADDGTDENLRPASTGIVLGPASLQLLTLVFSIPDLSLSRPVVVLSTRVEVSHPTPLPFVPIATWSKKQKLYIDCHTAHTQSKLEERRRESVH